MKNPKPFLKWVGGKRQLLKQLIPLLPKTYNKYFEPFVGGAAMFFELQPENVQLSDFNIELIDCYSAIKNNLDEVIKELKKHKYELDYYYNIRSLKAGFLSTGESAARTIYLNKTGFNGLYRVNKSGKFNVPFGKYKNPTICDEENLIACSKLLQRCDIRQCDFENAVCEVSKDDFIYFDPPYVPLNITSDFTSYTPFGFNKDDHKRLKITMDYLTNKNVNVMLSNSDTPLVRKLYKDYNINIVYASRSINSNGNNRGKINELVIRNYK